MSLSTMANPWRNSTVRVFWQLFAAGHCSGALHIGKGVIERDIEKHEIAESDKLILYCGGGFRSAIAAKSLQDMGYTDVVSLWGGWRSILAEGLETTK